MKAEIRDQIGQLFDPLPEHWGLRGDPFLWQAMKDSLSARRLPTTASSLIVDIERAFEKLSGRPLYASPPFYMKEFAHGGMSSGGIDPSFWRGIALPLLLSRYAEATAERLPDCSLFSEKQLDKILDNEFRSNPSFVDWFLAKSKFAAQGFTFLWSRSDHPWAKSLLTLPGDSTGPGKTIEREGETDILVVFENESGVRVAVHIENKKPGGKFLPFQADGYKARAAQWVGKQEYCAHVDWESVLVAPIAFLNSNRTEANKFDRCVPYEVLAERVPAFRMPQPGPHQEY